MKFVYYLAVLMLSGLVVLASVFVPVVVSSRSDLVEVKLGEPLPFLLQEQTGYDPSLPWQVYFYSPLEVPTRILWPQFLLDVTLVFGALVVILRVILPMSSLLPPGLASSPATVPPAAQVRAHEICVPSGRTRAQWLAGSGVRFRTGHHVK